MGEALGLMYSATESFRLWHRTDFQQDVAEERQEENKYTGEYGVFGHTTTSLQLFAILYKIYMAQNENKCYSIWVKYIWKICRISGKQWYIIRQMCDFWR